MILHLVTDGRRLAGSDDPAVVRRALLGQTRAAMAAGVDMVQIRESWMSAREMAALVRQVVTEGRSSGTRVLVNDRLDVALASGAHGIHLKGASIAPDRVRRIAPAGYVIGLSVHSAEEAANAAGLVDYLVAGTVWSTPSKPDEHPLIGVEGLRAIVGAAQGPVLAIGGVTLERVGAVAATGAAGIAGIRLFAPPSSSGSGPGAPGSLSEVVASLRRRV
jgi:thiamine-phosphate pyrophosphorylase